jgi:trans-feruloyl-CoA hydratase/vanillin synthase
MAETNANSGSGKWGENVKVSIEDGIAWISLNRPDQRNAISPGIVWEMVAVLDAIEVMDDVKVVVISGTGKAFSAGMDLKEFFRAYDHKPPIERERLHRANAAWQWRRLMFYPKPTIAMVNGWCFGGAFQVVVACDLAIAAEDATFGLSEINWGIIPAGVVTKAVEQVMSQRNALYYIMTGKTFDGRKAAQMGLVNEAVPAAELRAATIELAKVLMEKNPFVLRQAKVAYRYTRDMSWDQAAEYLAAKADQAEFRDPEDGRNKGLSQFVDEKTYRPGLGAYRREV